MVILTIIAELGMGYASSMEDLREIGENGIFLFAKSDHSLLTFEFGMFLPKERLINDMQLSIFKASLSPTFSWKSFFIRPGIGVSPYLIIVDWKRFLYGASPVVQQEMGFSIGSIIFSLQYNFHFLAHVEENSGLSISSNRYISFWIKLK